MEFRRCACQCRLYVQSGKRERIQSNAKKTSSVSEETGVAEGTHRSLVWRVYRKNGVEYEMLGVGG